MPCHNDRESAKAAILNLKVGHVAYINWHEEGGGEVMKTGEYYDLYEVPQYGGDPVFFQRYKVDKVDDLIAVAFSWT